jgi:hypothetical protein
MVADKPSPFGYAALSSISANYFEVMGMRLLKGRVFTFTDTAEAPRVAVINETLAARRTHRQAIENRLERSPGSVELVV